MCVNVILTLLHLFSRILAVSLFCRNFSSYDDRVSKPAATSIPMVPERMPAPIRKGVPVCCRRRHKHAAIVLDPKPERPVSVISGLWLNGRAL
jgi:hypothetical protein